MSKCQGKVEIFSRVVGMFTPVQGWNKGKQEEFKNRKTYQINRDELKKDK